MNDERAGGAAPPDGEGAWPAEAVSGLRYRLGVSQREFARLLGVRQQTVSDWETGLHAPQGASRRVLSIVAEQSARYEVRRGGRAGGGRG